MSDRAELAAFAPAHKALAFQHIGDRVLLSMMMNAGADPGLHNEQAAPDAGSDALAGGDRSEPPGA